MKKYQFTQKNVIRILSFLIGFLFVLFGCVMVIHLQKEDAERKKKEDLSATAASFFDCSEALIEAIGRKDTNSMNILLGRMEEGVIRFGSPLPNFTAFLRRTEDKLKNAEENDFENEIGLLEKFSSLLTAFLSSPGERSAFIRSVGDLFYHPDDFLMQTASPPKKKNTFVSFSEDEVYRKAKKLFGFSAHPKKTEGGIAGRITFSEQSVFAQFDSENGSLLLFSRSHEPRESTLTAEQAEKICLSFLSGQTSLPFSVRREREDDGIYSAECVSGKTKANIMCTLDNGQIVYFERHDG